MEVVEYGCPEVTKALCRTEASERRVVDGAHVTGSFGWSVGCSSYGGDLLSESGAEVFWDVGWDERVRDRCCPWGLSACQEEQSD